MSIFRPEKYDKEERVSIHQRRTIIEEIDVSHLMRKKPSEVEEKDEGKIEEELLETDFEQNLSLRQQEAIDFIKQTGRITRLEYVVKFKVPLPMAERELEELIEMHLLTSSGKGPHKIYYIAEEKEDSK